MGQRLVGRDRSPHLRRDHPGRACGSGYDPNTTGAITPCRGVIATGFSQPRPAPWWEIPPKRSVPDLTFASYWAQPWGHIDFKGVFRKLELVRRCSDQQKFYRLRRRHFRRCQTRLVRMGQGRLHVPGDRRQWHQPFHPGHQQRRDSNQLSRAAYYSWLRLLRSVRRQSRRSGRAPGTSTGGCRICGQTSASASCITISHRI